MEAIPLATMVLRLGVALGLGLLVGLERERRGSSLAGVRTFAVVALFGGVAGLLSLELGGWVLAAGFLAVAGLTVMGNVGKLRAGLHDPGMTTEVALLLMFGLGAFLLLGPLEVGIALGGTLAILLYSKARLHGIVERLGDKDVTAIMRFALVTLVIFPVLPNQTFGPFAVLNPREIWLMVVLIAAISLGGYVAYKFLGGRTGTAIAGILGGVISSTATTVSYARKSRGGGAASDLSVVVILIASTIVVVRVLVEISVVAPGSLRIAAPPLLVLLLAFTILSILAWRRGNANHQPMPEPSNPTEFGSAIAFGTLYAAIILAMAASREWFGSAGMYAIGAVSGVADLDAITLSSANLARVETIRPETLWRVVMVAALANLAFKLGIVGVLGSRRLLRQLLPYFLAGAGVAVLVLLLWPGG
ncbi:MAG: MgtC/SapB family protein [Gemmatimonadota bacterium]